MASVEQPPVSCIEHGRWTSVPVRPAPLRLKSVDRKAHERARKDGKITWHMVGCSGDPVDHAPQTAVIKAMAAQTRDSSSLGKGRALPTDAAFFYHLGDIVYKPDDPIGDPENPEFGSDAQPFQKDLTELYREQFYVPLSRYGRPIFALAGNHDGKVHIDTDTGLVRPDKSPIYRYQQVFGSYGIAVPLAEELRELARGIQVFAQPGVYWNFETPQMSIIALYTNVVNGGQLDAPDDTYTPQLRWLIHELERLGAEIPRRPIVIASHYPPFSGAANFAERGDPNLSPTPRAADRKLDTLATLLRKAYDTSGVRPDLVVSAHAHHYQRLTYRFADGYEIPHLIAGSGGHGPIEKIAHACDGTLGGEPRVPYSAIAPGGFTLPVGDSAMVVSYNDSDFGFLRFTASKEFIRSEFFTVSTPESKKRSVKTSLYDAFLLDTNAHVITPVEGSAR